MAGGAKARGCDAPEQDQVAFIEANAVALVREKNAKIARLRQEITLLHKSKRELRRQLRIALGMVVKLQAQVEGHAERIAAQSELLSRKAEKPT